MPTISVAQFAMNDSDKPSWSNLSALGIFAVPTVGGRFDRHFHDCDEYWLVYSGRARIMTEGVEYDVGAGDVVCTHAGDEHDVVAVYEDFEAYFLEDVLVGDQRKGHLHASIDLALGHDVPLVDTSKG